MPTIRAAVCHRFNGPLVIENLHMPADFRRGRSNAGRSGDLPQRYLFRDRCDTLAGAARRNVILFP